MMVVDRRTPLSPAPRLPARAAPEQHQVPPPRQQRRRKEPPVVLLPLKDKLSLFRTRRYQSWRSAATPVLPNAAAAAPASREVGRVGRAGGSSSGNDSNSTAVFNVEEEEDVVHEKADPIKSSSLRTAEATLLSSSTSTPHPSVPIVEGGTVMATPESRRVMRHISGLGMEDPTLFVVTNPPQQQQQQQQRQQREIRDDTRGRGDVALPVFQDMTIEDMPVDIRTTLSVESDPTATLSDDGAGGDLLDMELFHSSLGHITGWVPARAHDGDEDEEECYDEEDAKKKRRRESKQKKNSNNATQTTCAPSDAPADTEQHLLNLPCDADVDRVKGPPPSGGATNRPTGVTDSDHNPTAALCTSLIEEAMLGASLNSLQSLSLDEIRMHSSMSQFANPAVFLASEPPTDCRKNGTGPSSPRQQPPKPQHYHDRLHQSVPRNVKITTTPAPSSSHRPAKPEFKAPPSVVALSGSGSPSTSLPSSNKSKVVVAGADGTKKKQSSSHDESLPAAKPAAASSSSPSHPASTSSLSTSSPTRRPVVVIPKKRALPSIQCLFPEDSDPAPLPAPRPSPTGGSSSTGMASC